MLQPALQYLNGVRFHWNGVAMCRLIDITHNNWPLEGISVETIAKWVSVKVPLQYFNSIYNTVQYKHVLRAVSTSDLKQLAEAIW